jgi:uncharacterized protein (DUF58 family)
MSASPAVRWLLGLMVGVGFFGWAVTGSVTYVRLVYAGALLVLGSYLWALYAVRGVKLRRTTRLLRQGVGEIFEEQFEIANHVGQPCFWMEVDNQTRLPGADGSRLLVMLGGHRRRSYQARTWLVRRGAYPLGPTRIASGDPFGLFAVQKKFPAEDVLVVLPMSFPISSFPPPPGVFPGGKTIRHRAPDMAPHVSGVREYVPGDPVKRIHWPNTARRGRLMVKEFEQDPQADLWIFLDAFQPARVASVEADEPGFEVGRWLRVRPQVRLPRDTFEYAVSAAASLAQHFLQRGRAVGLACASARFTVVAAERGERQVGKLMELLAFLEPEGNLPLPGLVQMQAGLLPPGSGVILITPAAAPETVLAVEDLRHRNLQPLVVLIRPETFGSHGDSQPIVDALLGRDAPVVTLGYGDDLSARLALPALYFDGAYRPTPASFVYPT